MKNIQYELIINEALRSALEYDIPDEQINEFIEFFGKHIGSDRIYIFEYNVKNVDLPFGILPKTEKGRHYEGWYVGGGLTYGYQWLLSEHLNLEGSIGLGYIYSPYKLYGRCDKCLDKDHRNYVGPTKAALSLIYAF